MNWPTAHQQQPTFATKSAHSVVSLLCSSTSGIAGIADASAASARQIYRFMDWMHRPPPAPQLLDGPRPQVLAKPWRREVTEHDNVYRFTGAGGPYGSLAVDAPSTFSRSPASTRC